MDPRLSLKDFLRPYRNNLGIMIASVQFPPMKASFFEPDWVDWTWRLTDDYEPAQSNVKTLAHVGLTYYHSVHAITGSHPSTNEPVLEFNRSVIRVNHFRQGVPFVSTDGGGSSGTDSNNNSTTTTMIQQQNVPFPHIHAGTMIQDFSFQKAYGNRIRELVHAMN